VIRALHRVDLVGDVMRAALTTQQAFADTMGADGAAFLHALSRPEAPAAFRTLPALDLLRQVWRQTDVMDAAGSRRGRATSKSPPAAHDACKPTTQWVGYTGHLPETGDDALPPRIVHGMTTTPVDASQATAPMHAAFERKGLLPVCPIVATDSVAAARLADSRRASDSGLGGAARGSVRGLAQTAGACDVSPCTIAWEQQRVPCPMGHTSLRGTPALDQRDTDGITITVARGDGRDGAARARYAERAAQLDPTAP
jgi:transposase